MNKKIKNIKDFINDYSVLIFLIVSALIVVGAVHLDNYNKLQEQLYLEAQLQLKLEEMGYYKTVVSNGNINITKAQLIEVEQKLADILNKFEQITYIHCFTGSDIIYYEFIYEGINEKTLKTNREDIGTLINYINATLVNYWNKIEPNINIAINLLDEENYECILLTSENSEIIYSIFDSPEKEGTKQDWIDLFYYENGYEPSEKALTEFKTKKINAIYGKEVEY